MSRVRDHWSIGEVLSLLQDEFPEVTISKIRFLESQGLIDPERTPSGYRKFSDGDYDRLYWILEQQRDHYLPLRVIRDRLDEGQDIGPAPRRSELRIGDQIEDDVEEADVPIPPQAPEGYDAPLDPEAGLDGTFADALADVEGPVAAVEDSPADHPVRHEEANALAEAMAEADPEPSAPEPVDEAEPETPSVAEPEKPQAEEPAPEPTVEAAPEPSAAEGEPDAQPDPPPDSEPVINIATDKDSADTVNEPRPPAPRLLGTRTEKPLPTSKTAAEALAPAPRPSLPGSSVALTGDELAEQSGSTPGMVAELEKYGMISPRQVGNAVLFDSTALTVARLAVQFGRYGLEPRHLKTFRLGAEREVALLTQSIGPTLKANNPETRRRSFDTLQDLAELSASLRSIIVRDLVADLEPEG